MPQLNEKYWNNRYTSNNFSWDLGTVSPPLKAYIDQLTDKTIKILVPGAGNAYEVQYLFEKGFTNVFLLDFAKHPLLNFKNRFPGFPEENLLHQNFFDATGHYDLIIEQTFFVQSIRNCVKNTSKKH